MKKKEIPKYKPTARVKRCLDSGSIAGLFPLLKDWSVSELQALLDDLDQMQKESIKSVEAETSKHMFTPENFFSDRMVRTIIDAQEKVSLGIIATCSEIASVAVYYLEQHGVTVHPEGEPD